MRLRGRYLWWMVAGVVLGIGGLVVSFYLLTNPSDVAGLSTQDLADAGVNCGTLLDPRELDPEGPCQEALERQLLIVGGLALGSLAVIVGSVIIGVRRLMKAETTPADEDTSGSRE